jgi:ACR3 family arsenite efflux pump ArsB
MWLRYLWRAIMWTLFRETQDRSEEGLFEGALQIGCLIVAVAVCVAILLVWLSRK